jgi:hypothetical protein
MSEKSEGLERRLKRLKPLEQEALAAKILDDLRTVKREGPSAGLHACRQVIADAASALPRSYCTAFCSACAGAIVGAAATILTMTFLVQPKVEIREVVREVRVMSEPTTDLREKPEAELVADPRSSPETESENPSVALPNGKNKFDDQPTVLGMSFRDLDVLIAERQAIARQIDRRNANVGFASPGFASPRISPDEYHELLRELKL